MRLSVPQLSHNLLDLFIINPSFNVASCGNKVDTCGQASCTYSPYQCQQAPKKVNLRVGDVTMSNL